MNLPEIHPREAIVEAAEREWDQFLIDNRMEHADLLAACYIILQGLVEPPTSGHATDGTINLVQLWANLLEKYMLTTGETMAILGRRLCEYAKYIIRFERHGRTDKPGGLV